MDIEKIISQMSLENKIAFCEGANFWETKAYEKYGIPSMFVCDGPNGLRKQDLSGGTDMLGVNNSNPATCFPAAVTMASSWDTDILQAVGTAIGEEARAQGVGIVLGPDCNLKRNPLCGRNFEYYSEDPYLSGKLAAGFIRGVEYQGVGTSLKHFAANSQELSRFTSDSILDERTLRELYLTGFEIAVKEGQPATVMCSYNKLNGTHASDHKELLTDILRTEWGFDGLVVTDWGAMNDRIEGFRAGCDLNMPGGSGFMAKECVLAVKNGTLSETDIDNSVRRILKQVFRAVKTLKIPVSCDYDAHHAIAREAVEAGAVLLKNDDGILPLNAGTKIAVIGAMAKSMRYQGAGSSHVNARKLEQPIDFQPSAIYAPGCDERGDTTNALIAEAVNAAKQAEVVVVFAGLPDRYESEGFDRDNMKMPESHVRLIEAVAQANANTVVVLLCGSAVECPWADKLCQEYMRREVESGEFPAYKANGMAYIRFAKEEKELFKLLYMRDRSSELIPETTEQTDKMESIVHNNTGLSGIDAKLFHLEMWAYVHGIATMFATGFFDLDWELVSRMLTYSYQGLRKQYGME